MAEDIKGTSGLRSSISTTDNGDIVDLSTGTIVGMNPQSIKINNSPGLNYNQYRALREDIGSNLSERTQFGNALPDFSVYDRDLRSIDDVNNIQAFRSNRQSNFLKATNAVLGGVVSGLATAVEDVGYILDLTEYAKVFTDEDGIQDNWLSSAMKDAKESLYSALPIYENPENSGVLDQFLRWSTLRSTLDSAIGFAIPGGIISKGLTAASRTLRASRLAAYLNTLSKVAQESKTAAGAAEVGTMQAIKSSVAGGLTKGINFLTTGKTGAAVNSIATGALTNSAEGTMMALELADTEEANYLTEATKQILKEKYNGDTQYFSNAVEDAELLLAQDVDFKQELARRQDEFVNRNRLFMLTDAMSVHGIFKGIGNTRNLLKNRGIKPVLGSLKTLDVDNPLIQMSKEGFEEIGQNVFQSEAGYQTRKASGLLTEEERDLDFYDRLYKFATSDQALVEGLMGFFSGGLQRGLMIKAGDILQGDPLGRRRKAEYDRQYKLQQEEIANYTGASLRNVINTEALKAEAINNGDPVAARFVNDVAFAKLATNAFHLGTTERLERTLEDIAAMDETTALDKGYDSNYREEANERLKDLRFLEGKYLDLTGLERGSEIFGNRVLSYYNRKQQNRVKQQANEIVSEVVDTLTNEQATLLRELNDSELTDKERKSIYDKLVETTNTPEVKEVFAKQQVLSKISEENNELDKEYNDMLSPTSQAKYRKERQANEKKLEEQAQAEAEKEVKKTKDEIKEEVAEVSTPEEKIEVINRYKEEANNDPIINRAAEEAAQEIKHEEDISKVKAIADDSNTLTIADDTFRNDIEEVLGKPLTVEKYGMPTATPLFFSYRQAIGAIKEISGNNEITLSAIRQWLDENKDNSNPNTTKIYNAISEIYDRINKVQEATESNRNERQKVADLVTASTVRTDKKVEEELADDTIIDNDTQTDDNIQSKEVITDNGDISSESGSIAMSPRVEKEIEAETIVITENIADSNTTDTEKEYTEDPTKVDNGANSVAYQTRRFKYTTIENKRVRVPIDNEISNEEIFRVIADNKKVYKGAKIKFTVLDRDDIVVYASSAKGSVPIRTTWGEYKRSILLNKNLSESQKTAAINNKIPITITTINDELIGYVHDTDWSNSNNIAKGKVRQSKQQTALLRSKIVSGEITESTVTRKTKGFLMRAVDPMLTSKALPSDKLTISVYKNGRFVGNTPNKLVNVTPFKEGYTYIFVPVDTTEESYLAMPVKPNKLVDTQVNSIKNAIDIFIKATTGQLNESDKALVNSIMKALDNVVINNGLTKVNYNITTSQGLKNYISLFTYVYNTTGMSLANSIKDTVRGYKAISVEENENTLRIDVTTNGDNTQNGTFKIDLKTGRVVKNTLTDELLLNHLSNSYFHSNSYLLGRSINIPYITNTDTEAKLSITYEPGSYNNYIKQNTSSFIFSYNIGTALSPNYVYFEQPKVLFDISRIFENNTAIAIAIDKNATENDRSTVIESTNERKNIADTRYEDIDVDNVSLDDVLYSIDEFTLLKEADYTDVSNSQVGISLITADMGKITIAQQRQVVDSIVGEIIETLINSDADTLSINAIDNIFTKRLDWFRRQHNIVVSSGKNEALAAHLLEYIDNWNNLKSVVKNTLTRRSGVKVVEVQNEDIDSISTDSYMQAEDSNYERTRYTDSYSLELDSKDSLSSRMKLFLSDITDSGRANYLTKENIYVPFDEVYNKLSALLSNGTPSFDDMLAKLNSLLDENTGITWLPNLINKLSTAPARIKNEFVVAMNKHHVNMEFAMISNRKKATRLQVYETNANSIRRTIMNSWYNNLLHSTLVEFRNGEFIYNEDTANKLKAEYNNWKTTRKYPTGEELKTWLGNLGINLSDATIKTLIEGEFTYRGATYSYASLFNHGKLLDNIISKVEPSRAVNTEEGNLFRDSMTMRLADLEAKNNIYLFSNSHKAGSKTVYSYTNDKYLIDRLYELKNNRTLLTTLSKVPFVRNSLWLKQLVKTDDNGNIIYDSDNLVIINKDSNVYQNFDYAYLSLEALKRYGSKYNTDRSLDALSPAEHELVKLTMFINNNSIDSSGLRTIKLFYPTFSDKTTTLTLAVPAVNTDIDIVDFIYENVVLPEIDRIINYNTITDNGNVPVDIEGYNDGAYKFLIFPALNYIDELFNIVGNKRVLNPAVRLGEGESSIKEVLTEQLNNLVVEQINRWHDSGIGLIEDGDGRYSFKNVDSKYLSYLRRNVGDIEDHLLEKEMAIDYVVNYIVGNANILQLFIGDPALYYKSKSSDYIQQAEDLFINMGKRLAGDIAPGQELDFSSTDAGSTFNLAVVNDAKLESLSNDYYTEALDFDKDDYANITGSDAQELTTLGEHLNVMFAAGKLSEAQYRLLMDKYKKGGEYTKAELNVVLQPIKPVYVNNVFDSDANVDVRVYIKSSSFPLIPQLTRGLQIDALRRRMEDKNSPIDRLAFVSAVKVGAPLNRETIFDSEGNIDIEAVSRIQPKLMPRIGFKIQQEVPYHEDKDRINGGTQERKLLFSGIKDIKRFKYNGKEYTGEQLEKVYDDIYKQIFDTQLKDLQDRLDYDENTGTVDSRRLSDLLREEALKRGYTTNDLLGIEINKDGNFRFPLWSLPSSDKYEALLLSIIDNRVRKVKIPGYSYVLGTEEGFRVTTDISEIEDTKNNIVFTSSWTGKLLPQRVENGVVKPTQILIPSRFRDIDGNLIDMSKYATRDKDGFLRLNERKIPKELLNIFAFRIPTQGHNSMAGVEIVGFLPNTVGDLAIASRDFTVQMGSDFD